MLSKKQTISLIAILVTVIISEMIISVISNKYSYLSAKSLVMLTKLEINNAEEYHGTCTGYEEREQVFDDDTDDYGKRIVQYPVVQYKTSDGTVKTVVSCLTDSERGKTLDKDVVVLDNGSEAVILQDQLDLKRSLQRSIICTVLQIAIMVIAMIPVIMIGVNALKNRANNKLIE